MKKTDILLLLILLLGSCSKPSLFPISTTIEGKAFGLKDSLNMTTRICYNNNKLILVDKDDKTFITCYDIEDNTFTHFVEKGEAPEQMLSMQVIGVKGEKLYGFDTSNQNFKEYRINDGSYVGSTNRLINYTNLFARPLNDSLYIGCPYNDSIRVLLYNKKGEIIAKNYQYPYSEEFAPSFAHMFACMSDMLVHPTENKFAMTTQYAQTLQIFGYKEDDIWLITEKDMIAPQYNIENTSFKVNANTQWGYLSITGDEKYIYLLYSGAIQSRVDNPCIGNTIHVFNWEGEPIIELKVKEMLTHIYVANNKLYAIQSDASTDWGFEIVEYDLKVLNSGEIQLF